MVILDDVHISFGLAVASYWCRSAGISIIPILMVKWPLCRSSRCSSLFLTSFIYVICLGLATYGELHPFSLCAAFSIPTTHAAYCATMVAAIRRMDRIGGETTVYVGLEFVGFNQLCHSLPKRCGESSPQPTTAIWYMWCNFYAILVTTMCRSITV